MSNDSEPTPPDNNRIPADMDATILPGASGASNSNPPSKVPADIDATILPGARGHDSDATIIPGARGAPSGAGQQAAPNQSFAPRLERIGDCKVEKRLGVGGFGEVWLATQESDLLKRRVAIKLLKAGMDSTSVLERFELERKVLSTLNHPSISRLYGGGVTEDGRSYFIMEFVEGLTLGLWCKRQKLTVTERLAIFRQVCSAVAHAHAVGIVHRDLKPDNIMVTAEGVPKLLDFGIAKIINKDVQEQDRVQDMPGEVGPLTPMYASPEQWRGEPLSASTDIYSLGVILFETLTEQLPFDFSNLSIDQIRKMVCETSPALPSEVSFRTTSSIGQTQTGIVATGTATVPEGSKSRLRKKLRGDLDNIVLMAMRTEPGRRYASVDALIADLDAYAASMPVSARPTSAGYRAQKWMGRNKKKVFLTTAATAALVFGIGWFVYAQIAKADAALKAQIAQKELDAQKADAALKAQIAQKELEAETQKKEEEQKKLIAKDTLIFDRFKSLPGDFAQNPEISLPIIEDYENSLRVNMKLHPDDSALQLEINQNLVKMFTRKAKVFIQNKNIKEGLASTSEQLALAKAVFEKTKDVKDRRELGAALQLRGDIFFAAKDFPEAKNFYQENIALRQDICKEKPSDIDANRDLSKAIVRLRDLAKEQGQLDIALKYSTDILALRTKLKNESKGADPKKIDTVEFEWLVAGQWHAEDLRNMDRLDEAEKEIVQTLPLVKQRAVKTESAANQTLVNLWEGLLCEISLDKQDFKKALSAANRMVKATEASLQLSNSGSRELEMFVDAAGLKALVQADMGDAEDSLDTIQSTTASANRMRDKNKQLKGDAINDERLLMMYSYEMRALRLLGRIDEAKEVGAKALALGAQRHDDAGAGWFAPKSNSFSQSALLEKDSDEAIRLAKAGVSEATNAKDPLIQLESYEALVEVLRKFASKEEVAVEIAKATDIASRMKRPKADAILKRIQVDTKPGKPAVVAPKTPATAAPTAATKTPAIAAPTATPKTPATAAPTTAPKTPATAAPTTAPKTPATAAPTTAPTATPPATTPPTSPPKSPSRNPPAATPPASVPAPPLI